MDEDGGVRGVAKRDAPVGVEVMGGAGLVLCFDVANHVYEGGAGERGRCSGDVAVHGHEEVGDVAAFVACRAVEIVAVQCSAVKETVFADACKYSVLPGQVFGVFGFGVADE